MDALKTSAPAVGLAIDGATDQVLFAMSHRSLPQNLLDDVAFPIRVKLRVPEEGFGTFLLDPLRWLREELGEGNFARHGADAIEGEALAIHFRRIEDALEFLAAFPEVRLADGTGSRGYRLQPLSPRTP